MLELLISILISLGIQFTSVDGDKVQISSKDATTLKSSEEYQKSGIDASESIIVTDDIDPNQGSSTNE